jgi:hypothetical protein
MTMKIEPALVLPFYDTIAIVQQPTALISSRNASDDLHETLIYFEIANKYAHLIDDYGSRTTTPRIEVQLRLFRVRIHE